MLAFLRTHFTEDELKAGTIIDVGANDGHFLSWSLEVENAGYRVLCIEGNPNHALILQERRKEAMIAAISDEDGKEADFFIWGDPPAPSYTGLIAHPNPSPSTIKVRTRTLTSILIEKGITNLLFLGIDIEGGEPAALRGLDFVRWSPKLVMVEEHFLTQATEAKSILLANNYCPIYSTGYDVVYKKQEGANA